MLTETLVGGTDACLKYSGGDVCSCVRSVELISACLESCTMDDLAGCTFLGHQKRYHYTKIVALIGFEPIKS